MSKIGIIRLRPLYYYTRGSRYKPQPADTRKLWVLHSKDYTLNGSKPSTEIPEVKDKISVEQHDLYSHLWVLSDTHPGYNRELAELDVLDINGYAYVDAPCTTKIDKPDSKVRCDYVTQIPCGKELELLQAHAYISFERKNHNWFLLYKFRDLEQLVLLAIDTINGKFLKVKGKLKFFPIRKRHKELKGFSIPINSLNKYELLTVAGIDTKNVYSKKLKVLDTANPMFSVGSILTYTNISDFSVIKTLYTLPTNITDTLVPTKLPVGSYATDTLYSIPIASIPPKSSLFTPRNIDSVQFIPKHIKTVEAIEQAYLLLTSNISEDLKNLLDSRYSKTDIFHILSLGVDIYIGDIIPEYLWEQLKLILLARIDESKKVHATLSDHLKKDINVFPEVYLDSNTILNIDSNGFGVSHFKEFDWKEPTLVNLIWNYLPNVYIDLRSKHKLDLRIVQLSITVRKIPSANLLETYNKELLVTCLKKYIREQTTLLAYLQLMKSLSYDPLTQDIVSEILLQDGLSMHEISTVMLNIQNSN